MDKIKVTHPDYGGREIEPAALETYEALGWSADPKARRAAEKQQTKES